MDTTPGSVPSRALPPVRTATSINERVSIARAVTRHADASIHGSCGQPVTRANPKVTSEQTTLGELSARLNGRVDEVEQPFNPGEFLRSRPQGSVRRTGASLAGAALSKMLKRG